MENASLTGFPLMVLLETSVSYQAQIKAKRTKPLRYISDMLRLSDEEGNEEHLFAESSQFH